MDTQQDRNIVVFDLETQRTFQEIGGRHNLRKLGLAVGVTYSTRDGAFRSYTEETVGDLIEELKAANLVVGFNVVEFDYEVLRAYTDYPLRRIPTVDVLQDIYHRLGFRLSLDAVARATLGTNKSADGLQAVRWYRQGQTDKIIEYCKQDVEVTHQLYEFGRDHGYIEYWDRSYRKRKIPVNWRR